MCGLGIFMQFAKDSFFLALQERLAALNPARTVTLNGATVPAIVVTENLPPRFQERLANTFYIEWGAAEVVSAWDGGAILSLDVDISYSSCGSVESMVDRGRLLGQLDSELLSICHPANTEKRDYTQSPSVDLGTRVSWNLPAFKAEEEETSGRVDRLVAMRIFFFSEAKSS